MLEGVCNDVGFTGDAVRPLRIRDCKLTRDFKLYGKDIAVLKSKAEEFERMLESLLGDQQVIDDGLTVGQVNYAIRQRCGEDRYYGIQFKDLSSLGEDVKGVVYDVPIEREGDCVWTYFIFIDKKYEELCNHLLPTETDEEKEVVRELYRGFKLVAIHEICHILLFEQQNHVGGLPIIALQNTENTGDCAKNVEIILKLMRELTRQYALRGEDDCYLLTYLLAFWPIHDFKRRVTESFTPQNWQLFDVRAHLANHYNMPVKDTVVWLVVLFGERWNAHFIRRRESDRFVIDTYAHDKNMQPGSLTRFFDDETRIAYQVAKNHIDKKTSVLSDGEYVCVGLYEGANAELHHDAETIVFGFSARRIIDPNNGVNHH